MQQPNPAERQQRPHRAQPSDTDRRTTTFTPSPNLTQPANTPPLPRRRLPSRVIGSVGRNATPGASNALNPNDLLAQLAREVRQEWQLRHEAEYHLQQAQRQSSSPNTIRPNSILQSPFRPASQTPSLTPATDPLGSVMGFGAQPSVSPIPGFIHAPTPQFPSPSMPSY
jgi:hypothetical protein